MEFTKTLIIPVEGHIRPVLTHPALDEMSVFKQHINFPLENYIYTVND